MKTPEPQIDDDIAHEPFDWKDWLEGSDHICYWCGGKLVYDGYDSIHRQVYVHCERCDENDYISTEEAQR